MLLCPAFHSDGFHGSNSGPHAYTEGTLKTESSSQHSLILTIGKTPGYYNEATKETEKACSTQRFHKQPLIGKLQRDHHQKVM